MLPPGKPGKRGEYVINVCPKLGCTDSLWWNYLKGTGQCFKCGLKIGWSSFKMWFGMDGKVSASDFQTSKKKDDRQAQLKMELEESSMVGSSAWDVNDARVFLMSKWIDRNTCDKVPIKWDWNNRAMVLPVDAADLGVTDSSVLWRRPNGWPDKWIGPGIAQGSYVFGYRHIQEKKPGIIIFEGAHDILCTGLLGHGIAILGSDISDPQAKFISSNWTNCIIWLDPDKAGKKGTRVLMNRLSLWGKGRLTVTKYVTEEDPKMYRPGSPEVNKVLEMVCGRSECTVS